jgi:hypothetical protein
MYTIILVPPKKEKFLPPPSSCHQLVHTQWLILGTTYLVKLSIFREEEGHSLYRGREREGEGEGREGSEGDEGGGGVKGFVRKIPPNHFCHQIEFTGPAVPSFFACYVPPLNKQLIERLLMSLVNLTPFLLNFLTKTLSTSPI